MKKKIEKQAVLLSLISILVVGAFVGCSKEKTLDLDAFAKSVLDQVEYDDELVCPPEKTVNDLYDLSFDGLEESVIYISGSSATANELAVFKLKDSTAMQSAKKAVEQRIADLKEKYEGYRPDELYRIENAITVEKGRYLLFSVSGDNAKVEKIFEESFR